MPRSSHEYSAMPIAERHDGSCSVNLSIASSEQVSMSKRDLIDRIIQLNRSAKRDFLQSFTEGELADYLRQLESVGPVVEYIAWPMAS